MAKTSDSIETSPIFTLMRENRKLRTMMNLKGRKQSRTHLPIPLLNPRSIATRVAEVHCQMRQDANNLLDRELGHPISRSAEPNMDAIPPVSACPAVKIGIHTNIYFPPSWGRL